MSDERDSKVSQRYRELGAEGPPRELDQTILAAAHRAADKPHAPLVAPVGRHRWYFALGAAAVLVLSIAITIHLEGERPDPEAVSVAQVPPASQDQAPKPAPQRHESESRDLARADRARPQGAQPDARIAKPAPAAPPAAPEQRAAESASPERWLERILELRKAGRHEDAEKELAEFRKRYPAYKLPENVVRP